ncbi:MAG: hypothetical protein EAZ90_26690 [Oscillatoriales cyanobacterium]|nr:hypothetical protein [Microcoleus sp. PH2017_37_MFU_D_B]TAE07872.1 MAG: hypothetical protein EAZ94_27135 [Oscillatoriales cyanobacterium]TAE19184.1 MAG: hypothetical protein EAZ93_27485 [Oscillatoriales cyanobacterium]TAE37368.1 MAG: hypothetical protein EAZ90_26690 [Oscillatoriales cyanobacterium]TAE63467.1 MAG: hypothetical protein EAZ86_28870 [Oscillatoriales cyanobacterium]
MHLLIYSPVTPHLFPENLGNLREFTAVRAIAQKKPGQNWSGVNYQGASTNLLSWEFSSNPDSCIKIFNRSLDDTQNLNFAVGRGDRISDGAIELASAPE